MTANRGLFVTQLNTGTVEAPSWVGTTPLEARLALAGMVAENSPGVPRTGLMFQSASTVVAGTGAMTYNVGPCNPVVNRSAGDGVYAWTLSGTTSIPTTLAPATGSRWDLIFTKQNDPSKGDPDNQALVGVVQGVASSTPSKPYASVPEGALVLAEAQVSAGALATNGGSVVITQVWRHTAARGAPIPVRNQTERDELSAFTGLRITRLDYKAMEQVYHGGGWMGSFTANGVFNVPAVNNGVSSGAIDVNYPFTFPGTPSVVVTPPSGRLTVTTTTRTSSDFKANFDNKSGAVSAAGLATYVATYTLT